MYNLFYYLLPEKTREKLTALAEDLKRNGAGYLAIGGITENLFSYSLRDRYYTRNDGAEAYEEALRSASDGLKLALEEPFQYQWPYMSAFLNMPLDGSEYMYTDEEVPFLTIALKGLVPMYSDYVNFEANKTELFLRLAETGVYPSFYITRKNSSDLIYTNSSDLYSTQWDAYRGTVVQYDRELRTLNDRTAGAFIENHEKLDGDVRKVTYSNGIMVYVNYSGESRSVDGITVGPESFAVTEKAAGGETP